VEGMVEAEVDFFFVFCREGRKRGGEVELAYRGLLSLWSSLYLFDHVNSNTNKFSSFDRYNITSLKSTIRLLWRTSSPKMSKKRDKSDGDTPKKISECPFHPFWRI